MKEEHERIPLRTILQNFLNHVENLDSDNLEGSYEKEFQELKLFSEILKTSDQYCCSEGQKEVNRKKNRYKDILPFDVSRVILAGYAGVPGSDYINANFIKGASGSLAYIASQGPLPHTVNDFWRMVVECKVQVIVMACNEEEAGKHKCENYWVDKEGEEKQFGMVTVRLVKASVVCPDFLVRTMMLKYANSQSVSEERTVCQFHYSAWPDHGVPPLVRPLLDMVRLVRDTQASETLPVLVHCSAGCGRTGTICAIDYVWGLLRAGKLTNDFSLFKLVRDMRKQRIAMVQTKEQYVLVHHAVRELFCEQLRMIDSHPYENIDVNGMPLIKECSDSESEPTYAIIGNISCDEKQDNKEKEVYAPPIPQKKRLHTPSSKQEKEVENLTEKQRLISQQSSDGTSFQAGGTPQKPRIAKLKAIFERSSPSGESHMRSKLRSTQQVTRSHSLGAVSKPDTHHRQVEGPRQNENDLSASRHKVNVTAHSSPVCPQPAIPIKRSKSLKVLGSGDQYKLIFTTVSKDSPGKALRTVGSCENNVKKFEAGPSTMGSDRSSKQKEQLECEKVKTKSAPSCVKSTNFNGRTANYNVKPSLNFRASEHLVPVCSQHRSSLDSFSTEDTLQFPLVNANGGVATKVSSSSSNSSNSTYGFNQVKTYNEQKTSALDKDACQIWQDCRNYLISNSKCDGYLPKGLVNKRQQSDLTDSMLKHRQFQNYSVDSQKKVTSVVVGLGVRERRNSFRQAVGTPKESSAALPEKEWCTYESGWVGNVQQNVDDIAKKSITSRTQLFSEVTSANSLHCSPNASNAYVDVFPNSVVPVTSLQVAVADPVDTSARNYNSRAQRLNKPTQDKKTGIQKTSDEVTFCETIGSPYNVVLKHNSSNTKTGVIGHKYVHNPPMQECRSLGQSKMDNMPVEQLKSVPVMKRTFQKSAWPQIEQGGSKIAPDLSARNVSGSSTATVKQLNTDYQEVNVSFAKRTPSSEGLSLFKSAPVSLKAKSKSFIGKSGVDVGASKSNNTPVNNSAPVSSGIKCVCDVTKPDMGKKVVTKSDPSQQSIPLSEKINGFKADTSRRMVDKRNHSHSTSVAASWVGVEAGDVLCNKRLKEVSSFSDSDSKTSASNKVEDSPINEKSSPNQQHKNEQDVVSYGLVAGVQLRRGTRDDMACQGPSTSAKVRRHASVVLLRHSLIETTPLTVWGPEKQGFTSKNSKVSPKRQGQDTGSDIRGVDLDTVPASTKPQGESGTTLSRTLEALHLKKPPSRTAEVPSASSGKTYGVIGIRSPRAQKKQHYL